MHPMLNIAIRAARIAGNLIVKHYEIPSTIGSIQKIDNDFIINLRCAAKRLIVEIIHNSYPKHIISSKEETGKVFGEDTQVEWIIDSLNGTINFIKRIPHFAVSIAVRIKNRTEVGVIYDPMRNELFTASRGQGVQMNNYRQRTGSARDLNGIILGTGFPFKQKWHACSYITLVRKLFIQCTDVRISGSAALDLAYVAAGRIDGFFEIGLKPYNFAAGELLVREAGGVITDFNGDHNYPFSGNVVAGNPRVVKAILSTMRTELTEELKC
ncbi:MAG: inositol-1-monophosphatase [Sodalis sp. (in: enterobacteria)]